MFLMSRAELRSLSGPKSESPAPLFYVDTKRYPSSLFPEDVMFDVHIRGIIPGGEKLLDWFMTEDPSHSALLPYHFKDKRKRLVLLNARTEKRGLAAFVTIGWDREKKIFRKSALPLRDRANDIRWMAHKGFIIGEGKPPTGHSSASL
jgi:hypothetical protein